jgi:ATP-dependent RNA helicase MSS116, mitochondrial
MAYCAHRHHLGLRYGSSQAAAIEKDEVPFTASNVSPSQPKPVSSAKAPEGQSAVGSEFPEFSTLKGKVSEETLRAVMGRPLKNLTHMSAVQAQVLPRLPELAEPYNPDAEAKATRDLLVKAKTGTGKTLAFLIPAVEARLRAIEDAKSAALKEAGVTSDKQLARRAERIFTRSEVGTLIISPTRELATQIANEAIKLTHFQDGFEVRLLVGGMSKGQQMRDWMKGRRDIVVATPGRLRDLLESEPEVAKGIAKTRQVSFPTAMETR